MQELNLDLVQRLTDNYILWESEGKKGFPRIVFKTHLMKRIIGALKLLGIEPDYPPVMHYEDYYDFAPNWEEYELEELTWVAMSNAGYSTQKDDVIYTIKDHDLIINPYVERWFQERNQKGNLPDEIHVDELDLEISALIYQDLSNNWFDEFGIRNEINLLFRYSGEPRICSSYIIEALEKNGYVHDGEYEEGPFGLEEYSDRYILKR